MTTAATTPLRIFADPENGKPEWLCPMLQPFFGGAATNKVESDYIGLIEYAKIAGQLFTLADRSKAQLAVLPWDWKWVRDDRALERVAHRCLRANTAAGLKTLIFHLDDSQVPIREPNTIVYRTSILGRKRQPNEFAQPAWANDFLPETANTLPLRPYTAKPVVGFCGASYRNSFKVPSWFRRRFRPHKCQYENVYPRGQGLRAYAIDQLAASVRIQTNIIERDAFIGGAFAGNVFNPALFATVRKEYIRHMVDCDYVLCARGGGNFSYRLYEALSLGRIPLFINTDCVLPFEELIPWRDLCVWIEQEDLPCIGDIVAEHHASLTPEMFVERQHRCREIWGKELSLSGFMTTLRGKLEHLNDG